MREYFRQPLKILVVMIKHRNENWVCRTRRMERVVCKKVVVRVGGGGAGFEEDQRETFWGGHDGG